MKQNRRNHGPSFKARVALEEALRKGRSDIFNTDQGSQFTSEAFTGLLRQHGVSISMDGKGSYNDNLFIESGCGVQ